MADIVDTMLGWIVDIFVWIFKAILKVCGWILKQLWLGVKALYRLIFKKGQEDASGATYTTEAADTGGSSKMMSYENILSNIDGLNPNVAGNPDETPQDRLTSLVLTGLLHDNLTFAQKARVVKKGDEKYAQISKNPIERGNFYVNLISTGYALINQMTNNAVQFNADKFNAGLDPNNKETELEPLGNYLIDIMNIVAAMYSPDGKSSFNVDMLEGVALPKWAEDGV